MRKNDMVQIVAVSSASQLCQSPATHEVNEDGVSLDFRHEDAMPLTTTPRTLQVQATTKSTTLLEH